MNVTDILAQTGGLQSMARELGISEAPGGAGGLGGLASMLDMNGDGDRWTMGCAWPVGRQEALPRPASVRQRQPTSRGNDVDPGVCARDDRDVEPQHRSLKNAPHNGS